LVPLGGGASSLVASAISEQLHLTVVAPEPIRVQINRFADVNRADAYRATARVTTPDGTTTTIRP
jgi:hypothetical protein